MLLTPSWLHSEHKVLVPRRRLGGALVFVRYVFVLRTRAMVAVWAPLAVVRTSNGIDSIYSVCCSSH